MIAVTGGAGFVGTNLCEALTDYRCVEDGDDLDFTGCDTVVHLAANADVRFGWDDPYRDLNSTKLTLDVLEAMRTQQVRRIIYASSSSVYGNAPIPTPETHSGKQTSLYGASKLACEGLIGAYHEAGHVEATIFRFTSMLGPHYRHGLIVDFLDQLDKSGTISVLGGGLVPRTRMHVADAVQAVREAIGRDFWFDVFNVSRPDMVTSLDVAQQVVDLYMPDATITTVEGSWRGDHPILLDATALRDTGWEPKWTIADAIEDTVDWLRQ